MFKSNSRAWAAKLQCSTEDSEPVLPVWGFLCSQKTLECHVWYGTLQDIQSLHTWNIESCLSSSKASKGSLETPQANSVGWGPRLCHELCLAADQGRAFCWKSTLQCVALVQPSHPGDAVTTVSRRGERQCSSSSKHLSPWKGNAFPLSVCPVQAVIVFSVERTVVPRWRIQVPLKYPVDDVDQNFFVLLT